MPDESTNTLDAEKASTTTKPVDDTSIVKPMKFRIEKIDNTMARKIDLTQSVSVINIDLLRQQQQDLENEIGAKQKILDDVTEIVRAFDSEPAVEVPIEPKPATPIEEAEEADEKTP